MLPHPLRTQLEHFGPLLRRLDTTRLEVVAIDLPGHGESSAPHMDYTADDFTGARTATLQHSGHFSCLEQPRAIARLIGGVA